MKESKQKSLEMYEMRLRKIGYKAIGEAFGISAERARQIVNVEKHRLKKGN